MGWFWVLSLLRSRVLPLRGMTEFPDVLDLVVF